MKSHARAPFAGSAAPITGSTPAAARRSRGLFGLACLCVLGLAAFLGTGAPSVGAAESFPGQGFLPDNRAWEMVSPSDKNGAEVMVSGTRTRAAVDGSALGFASLSAFGDAVGTSVSVDYMSVRGATAWSTHAITPPQLPTTGDGLTEQPFYAGVSADLSQGVFRAFSPLTDEPNVAATRNLYLRDDLRTPGAGSYTLLTNSETLQPVPPSGTGLAQFAAASSDFSHVIFESRLNLTADASGELPKLYEWDSGTVRLAGILPDSACGAPPCPAPSSAAGRGALEPGLNHTESTLSSDGSKVFFTSPVGFGGDPEPGSQIYMRRDHSETARVNASERTAPPPDPVSADAFFEIANPSGTRVFFVTDEQLTDTPVPDSSQARLYAYDTTLPDAAPDNLELIGEGGVVGVIGVSDDGEVVYFMSVRQLAPGAPAGGAGSGSKIYRWAAGAIRYVGTFVDGDDASNSRIGVNYGLARKSSRVSPDGRFLTFLSRTGEGLTGIQHSEGCIPASGRMCSEVYVYDAAAAGGDGELICASCNPDGASAATHATWAARVGNGVSVDSSHLSRPLSADGRRVFFSSGERLVPEDQNGALRDVYVFDTQTQEVNLISSGESTQDSYFLDASPSGNDVFFATRERLSGWDVDGAYDVYDARVNGGLPEPPAPPPSCQGDACQPAPVALNDKTPSSSTFAGPGDPSPRKARPRRRCAKNKHRVTRNGKRRCVKKGARRKNRANTDRRASR